jgi:hypothetical protein
MSDVANVLQSVSIIFACIAVVLGIDAWRREFIGKRRIELAEDVLARFYEARDAIARIRNPFSTGGEGSGRQRHSHEREEESELLDRAYVVFARYEKEQELFNRLHSLRYQIMARFSVDASGPFDELRKILNDIFRASYMLGRHYWPRQGRVQMTEEQFQRHLKEMHQHEAIFWAGAVMEDPIVEKIDKVILDIEAVCRPVITERSIGFILIEPITRIFRR